MEKPPKPREPGKKTCHECGVELPKSSAKSSENQEYIQYFCSPGCRRQWSEKNAKPQGI